jgi:hypothetical protein
MTAAFLILLGLFALAAYVFVLSAVVAGFRNEGRRDAAARRRAERITALDVRSPPTPPDHQA